jgi:DNA-binding Lrp family transcriptional regulator
MQPIDTIDRQIIAALRIDARKPVARLASELGIARATAEKRLTRMVENGTIIGFTIRARDDSPSTVRAMMLIEVAGRSTAAVIRGLKGFPELEKLHTTNGGWDLVAEIKAASLADFDRVLREVRSIDGVLNSETSLLLTSV